MDSWLISLGTLVGCLALAGFASSVETALVGVPTALVQNAIEQKLPRAQALLYWVVAPGRVLATLQFVRLACVIGVGIAALQLAAAWGWPYPEVMAMVGCSGLAFFLSHLLPRTLAKRCALRWAMHTMWAVRLLVVLSAPVVWPFSWLTGFVARFFGAPAASHGGFWTPDELSGLSQTARAEGLGKPGEDLLLSIIEFSDTVIREIMVPRTAMIAIPVSSSEEEVRGIVNDAGHSRIPVYEETIDNIVGILHVKDLFAWTTQHYGNHGADGAPALGGVFELKSLLRQPFYVPEVMKISELLREFQRRKTHMAIAVDEYGGTAGVVTLEDIIEEIVGEIQDEYDVEEKQFRILGDKVIADARVSVWDLEEALGVEFPDEGDYETLAGFLMWRVGYLPAKGAVITWNNLVFTVKEANEKRIGTVEIDLRGAAEQLATQVQSA